ncbi:hypothetical protein DFH06DRAFT_204175 [Mycena polygramma]|nr:hypothetical protein DFH06DRAFT_204175 [Mycena polygramma]
MPKRAREDASDPKLYEVEFILGARRTHENFYSDSHNPESKGFGYGWEYLVKWKGWPDRDNSWEPFEHFDSPFCILQFWDEAGHEALRTNVPGFEVHARPDWIQDHRSSKLSEPTRRTPSKKASTVTARQTDHLEARQTRSSTRTRKETTTSPQTPTRRRQTAVEKKLHLPIASPSGTQTPVHPREIPTTPTTPTTPLSPPLTPEREAEPKTETQSEDPSNLLDVHSQFAPTFVPDYTSPPTALGAHSNLLDVYIGAWSPPHAYPETDSLCAPLDDFGIQGSSLITPEPEFCDFLDTPAPNWPF